MIVTYMNNTPPYTHLDKKIYQTTRTIWFTWRHPWTIMCYIANTITIIMITKMCAITGIQQHMIRIPSTKILKMDHNTHIKDQKQNKYIDKAFKWNVMKKIHVIYLKTSLEVIAFEIRRIFKLSEKCIWRYQHNT